MIAGVIFTSTSFKQDSESGCQENEGQINDAMEDSLIASESSSKDIQHEIDIKNESETENRTENHDIIGLPSESDTLENEGHDSDIVDGMAITSNIDSHYSQNELEEKNNDKEVVDNTDENEVVGNEVFEEVEDKEQTSAGDADLNRVQNDDVIDEDKDKDKDEDEVEDDSSDYKSDDKSESDDDDDESNEKKNENDYNDDNDHNNGGKEEERSSQLVEDSSCRINISALKVIRNILLHLLPDMLYSSPSPRKCKGLKNCTVHLLVVMQSSFTRISFFTITYLSFSLLFSLHLRRLRWTMMRYHNYNQRDFIHDVF